MPPDHHLTAPQWREFFAGTLDRRFVRAGVRHLLARCARCSRLAAQEAGDAQNVVGASPRRDAIGRHLRQAQARRRAREQWDLLRPLSPADRLLRVARDPALASIGLCERLIEESAAACWSNPLAAAELAPLALAVAVRLPGTAASRRVAADLRGRALACLADARRVTGDLHGAWEALGQCEEELDGGTGDPMETAILHRSTGDLLLDLWRLDDACDAFSLAIEIYAHLADPDLHGQTLVQLALAIGPRDPDRALGLFETALAEMAPDADRRAELRALYSKTSLLIASGLVPEAASLLDQTRRLYRRLGDAPTLTRLHWLEARIAHRSGRTGEAEVTLRRLWHRLRDLGLPLELCLLSLDLIEVYEAQGKASEALPLARAFYPELKRYGRDEHAAALRGRFGWREE